MLLTAPNIAIIPISKAFGSVDMASSAKYRPEVFIITNKGSVSLAVGTITITGTGL